MANNNVMTSQKIESDTDKKQSRYSLVTRNWPVILILSVIGFYLITEHRAHLLGALPWLILLACPFLHIYMHRGHSHSSHHPTEVKDE